MDLQDDLDAYVLSDEELDAAERASHNDDEAIEPPTDADKANGMLRQLRGIARELRRIDMLAEQEIARISSWRNDRSFGLNRRRSMIEAALEAWMRAVNRVQPKRKSEALPNGTVKLRAGKRSVAITDPGAFLTWWRADTTMRVAKELHDLGVTDADTFAPELVEIVLSRSPLVKLQPEPSKTGIGEAGTEGDELPAKDDDVKLRAVVIDGEIVPGVAFSKPAADTFGVSL